MASGKKRRKLIAQGRRLGSSAGGPSRVRDGDRRRRTMVDQVRVELDRKRHERDWTIDDQSIDWSVLNGGDPEPT